MKKLLLLPIVLLTLTACNTAINFEPVTIDGFTVNVENEAILTTNTFEITNDADFDTITHETDIDEFVDGVEFKTEVAETLTNVEVIELLTELGIELPEMPTFESIEVTLSLVDVDFYHDGDFTFEFDTVTVNIEEAYTFENITFENAGTFVFEITDGEIVHTVIVTVTENIEYEILEANVEHDYLLFVNELTIDLSEYVEARMIELHMETLTTEVYELIAYAVYIEEARVEAERVEAERLAQQQVNQNRPQGNQNTGNQNTGNQGGGTANFEYVGGNVFLAVGDRVCPATHIYSGYRRCITGHDLMNPSHQNHCLGATIFDTRWSDWDDDYLTACWL